MPLMQGPILLQTLECYKPWALMAEKKYTDEYGATTATSLRNKQHIMVQEGLLLLIHDSEDSKLL